MRKSNYCVVPPDPIGSRPLCGPSRPLLLSLPLLDFCPWLSGRSLSLSLSLSFLLSVFLFFMPLRTHPFLASLLSPSPSPPLPDSSIASPRPLLFYPNIALLVFPPPLHRLPCFFCPPLLLPSAKRTPSERTSVRDTPSPLRVVELGGRGAPEGSPPSSPRIPAEASCMRARWRPTWAPA